MLTGIKFFDGSSDKTQALLKSGQVQGPFEALAVREKLKASAGDPESCILRFALQALDSVPSRRAVIFGDTVYIVEAAALDGSKS